MIQPSNGAGLSFACSIAFALLAFATPSQGQPISSSVQRIASFVMMKELPSWTPGKPEKSRRVLIREDGSGQVVEVVDNKVISLANFSYPAASSTLFPIDQYFALKDSYATPAVPGLIVEGRGDKTVFVMHANGRSKFISAENELLPPELIELRQKLPTSSGAKTGSFISVSLLTESAAANLRGASTLRTATPATIKKFPELKEAFSSPYKFVALTPEKWKGLLATLKLNPSAAFVKTATGNIVRIEFYQ